MRLSGLIAIALSHEYIFYVLTLSIQTTVNQPMSPFSATNFYWLLRAVQRKQRYKIERIIKSISARIVFLMLLKVEEQEDDR